MAAFDLIHGDALSAYRSWPTPATIVSDGGYGLGGFHGDPAEALALPDWYRQHIEAWSEQAAPATTLWFWNTELGWATVHPVLVAAGWDYVETVVWNKGVGHIAGNVNGKTIRRFPVATEVCVLYQRRLVLGSNAEPVAARVWLRREWQRSGLPLYLANDACSVANAATRKYLTQDGLWYFPPGEMVELMAAYATENGRPTDAPYFSLDGITPVTAKEWDALRYRWNHVHGLTNVWNRPPLRDAERLRGSLRRAAPRTYRPTPASASHLNQKPLDLMERLVRAVTQRGDVVWEPFGGLCSASVAAVALGRQAFAAEIDPHFAATARARLVLAAMQADPDAEEAVVPAG